MNQHKIKQAPKMKEAKEKYDGPINQHKMLAMGCALPGTEKLKKAKK